MTERDCGARVTAEGLKKKQGIVPLELRRVLETHSSWKIPMDGIIPVLSADAKERLTGLWRWCQDAGLKARYRIILDLAEGHTPTQISRFCGVSRSTVYRVAQRFRECGEAGVVDRREDNGPCKLNEAFFSALADAVEGSPQDHGWPRPTWTRELLAKAVEQETHIRVHVSTMSVALAAIGARRGRPKPTVACPWPEAEKERRLRQIQHVVQTLPADEVAVFEDEVDIHLNPKIGQDWMLRGQQKEVLTPGKNHKQYLAGAQDSRTGELIYVDGAKKNTLLFIRLLWVLVLRFAQATKIHVILDNYSIHATEQVRRSLETVYGHKIHLHFLPPYCPDDNKIERTWQDLHANVTRNHRCAAMEELMRNVRHYLKTRNRQKRQQHKRLAV
jgi:transposase